MICHAITEFLRVFPVTNPSPAPFWKVTSVPWFNSYPFSRETAHSILPFSNILESFPYSGNIYLVPNVKHGEFNSVETNIDLPVA